ncbi:hypothetical protein BDQ12DRAFT_616573, partial [Crucibulum laeve]
MLHNSAIRGYNIKNTTSKLIISLFGDDATVFLSEHDRFQDLKGILNIWCKASKAKFNIEKTEVIPMGSINFRQHLRNGTNNTALSIPNHIKIAKESEPVRTLGGFIGNNVNQCTPWGPVIEKIDAALDRWGKTHPSTEGRQLIIQMVVGGMTQYMTKVQGMPPEIQNTLQKRTRAFMCTGQGRPRIAMDTLTQDITQGGKNVLDLKSILITWIKTYLNFGNKRPLWTYVADGLIKQNATKNGQILDEDAKINPFLQDWSVNKTQSSSIPQDLIDMLKIAKKTNVTFHNMSTKIKCKLPIWHH